MDRTLENFITVLRRSGVRVSVSETMDAVRAVALSSYEDRQLLKDFLAVSLAKSQPEKQIFESCFDNFFNVEGLAGRNALLEKEKGEKREEGVAGCDIEDPNRQED